MTDLTVCIVNYNARNHLERCLESIFRGTRLSSFEVLVADNASVDGSVDMLAERFPQVTRIESGENLGFGRASNLCWQRAKSTLVLFLNSDTLLPEGALDRLVAVARSRPEAGAVGPLLRYEDGSIQMSYGNMPGILAELRQKLWNAGYARGKGPLASAVRRAYARERWVDWVSAACLLTRRDLLETVNGFDENFFLYSEDVDLCARIRSTGARILFTPEVEIVHLLGRSVEGNRERAIYESHRSRLYFYQKHRRGTELALLRLYLAVKAGAGLLLHPADRAAYRRVLELVRSGAHP